MCEPYYMKSPVCENYKTTGIILRYWGISETSGNLVFAYFGCLWTPRHLLGQTLTHTHTHKYKMRSNISVFVPVHVFEGFVILIICICESNFKTAKNTHKTLNISARLQWLFQFILWTCKQLHSSWTKKPVMNLNVL